MMRRHVLALIMLGAIVLASTAMTGVTQGSSNMLSAYDTVNCGGVDVPDVALSGMPSPNTIPYLDANPMCGGGGGGS